MAVCTTNILQSCSAQNNLQFVAPNHHYASDSELHLRLQSKTQISYIDTFNIYSMDLTCVVLSSVKCMHVHVCYYVMSILQITMTVGNITSLKKYLHNLFSQKIAKTVFLNQPATLIQRFQAPPPQGRPGGTPDPEGDSCVPPATMSGTETPPQSSSEDLWSVTVSVGCTGTK